METITIEAELAKDTVRRAAATASAQGLTFAEYLTKALEHYTDINRYTNIGRDIPSITDEELTDNYNVVAIRAASLYKLLNWIAPAYDSKDKDGLRYQVYIHRTLAIAHGSRPIGREIPEDKLASYEAEAENLVTAEDKDRLLDRMARELVPKRSRSTRRK